MVVVNQIFWHVGVNLFQMVGSTFAIEVLSSSSLYGVGTTVIKLLAWVYKAPKAFTRCRANGQELAREKSFRICNSTTLKYLINVYIRFFPIFREKNHR